MGFVKRKATTKAKISVEDFEEIKKDYLLDIEVVVAMDEIPMELVINFDQTGIHFQIGQWLKKGQNGLNWWTKTIKDN